ncbi:hypothetical protein BsWGS_15534 [Bradybaena similaris]
MSEIDLLETSTRDQLESLQVAVAQQQIYETELHHLSHVIDEAHKQMQASPINAASVGELRQLMADRTTLTEQIKYYNTKIQEVNEKMRQLALDSAQLSPSVFRKHYHPESAYSDYFAATSQHKRGVFPFHSQGQLFYDSLPVVNFPSFIDEDSSSPLARAFQDELENWKQSEHPKSVYGITPISLQLPRLIPPPRTDSIPRPTWSGEILATTASLSDMTRGTTISHSVDSPRTTAKAFEASASSLKSLDAVSVSNKQTHEVGISTATADASPENVQSVDAANTATLDSNTGEPSASLLICDTYTSAKNAAAGKLGLFAESAQTQAPVGGGPTQILLIHGFVNENNQRLPNDCNTSSECDPKTDESYSTDWVLATSPSIETQQHDRDTDGQDNMSLGAEGKVTPNVHAAKAKADSVCSISAEIMPQGQEIQVQITKQLQKLFDPMLQCDSLSDEDPIAAQKLHTDLLGLQELTLDIRNHRRLINEISDQRRHPTLSASNITTDAEVRENWERLNRDLAQRTTDLKCILRSQKPEDLMKISLLAPAKNAESTKEFEKVVKLVADLNSACNLQQTSLNKKKLNPKEALPFQQQHQLVLRNISDWLDLAEQQLFTVPVSTEEQIRHNENLRRQIQCLQINFDEMSKRPKDQAESTDSTNRELIEECHCNLNERLKIIETTTKLQADHLHQTEKQWKQYQVKVVNLQRQLQDIPKTILLPTATHSLDQLMSNNQKAEVQLKICVDQLQELKRMESSLTQKYPKGFFMSELMPLQSKYVELQKKALEKKSAIQNLIIFQDQYKKMLKDCADFIDMAEDKLRADSVATKDLSYIKSQLADSKDFFSDIEKHKATLDSLASNCDPSTRIQFQQQHASLSTRILVLVDQASLHGHRLERLTHQWADLEEKYTMLQEVLLSLEAQMPKSVEIDGMKSLAVIQDKCNKYKWLQGELALSKNSLIEVMKGKQILHSINCPSLETTITELVQKWFSLNTKLTDELKRTQSLGDLLSVFEAQLAILSSWLITAKMKLDGFKNVSAASLQNISVVRSKVEKILEFNKEVANQVLFKNKVMSIGHQLLENNTCDARSLSGRLQDCEEQWKQLETGVAETQEYLLQVQMKLMPSRQVLTELTDWIGELGKSVEKDACFVSNTTLDIEYMVKKYKNYQTELASRQLSMDFVNHVMLGPQAADVSISQEKLQFSENLQELNKQWHQMTIEVNEKLNTLEDVYSKWMEYGKALENLQSWFHQQEDIQSYQVIGSEVEVKQSLEDCSVLQQQQQFRQGELAVARSLGNYLIELSHDSPDSQQSIRDSLSTLDYKMKRLEEHTKQQLSILKDVLGHWTQYHSDLAILSQVVNKAEYALDHYKLLRGDIATLQSQRIKLKDLHAHLEKNYGQLESLSAVANQLRQVCEVSVQVDIQKTVSGMQNKWTQLSTDLIQRCTEYDHYLDEWQLFENQYSRMQDWLDAKEALCIDLDSVTIDASPETLTKYCTQLQQELDSFQSQAADLHRLNEMVTHHMNPSTVSIMKSRQSAIDQKLLALKQKLYQLSVTMSNDLSMHGKFENIFGAVRKFLSYVEVILDIDDPMKTAELEAIQLRFEQLSNLLLLFSHSYKELDDVNDLGYQLALSKNDATRLQELNHKWYMLYEDTKDRSRTLQGNLLQQQNFTSKCETWKTFMIQTEQTLADKVKGNLADLLAQLHNCEQFENEVYSRQQIIHAIISDGQKILATGEVEDSDEFQRKLNLVFEQWQSISRKASQRKIVIKDIVSKWHTFNALSQQLKSWVKNTEKYLQTSPSESNSLQVIKNSVEKLQEVQNEFQMQEAMYNNIDDLGEHLMQHAADRAAQEIKDTLSDIHQNRHKILSVIEQRRLQLEYIAQQWLGCESEVDDMLCQLTAIRTILNTDIPTTCDELRAEINRCKSIEKEFIESENKEQSLLAKEQQLVRINHTEDVSLLQQRIQLLTKQRRELQRQTKVREDKIVDALIRAAPVTTSKYELQVQRSQSPSLLQSRSPTLKSMKIIRSISSHRSLSQSQRSRTELAVDITGQTEISNLMEQLAETLYDCNIKLDMLEQTLGHSGDTEQSMNSLAVCEAAVDCVKRLEQQLKTKTGPLVIDSVDVQVKSIFQRWEQLQRHAQDLRLSQQRYDLTQFVSDIEHMLMWLDEAEILKSRSQYPSSYIVQHEDVVKQYKEFLSQLESKRREVVSINEHINQNYLRTELSRNIQLHGKLVDMNSRWKLILSWATDLQKYIQSSCIQYQDVITAVDDYHLWLEKTEAQVRHCETVNSNLSQSALLEKNTKLQELLNEVNNNRTRILTLKEMADQLLKSMEFPELSTARDKIYIVYKRVQALTPLILSYSTALEKRLKTTLKKDAQRFPFVYSRTKDIENIFTEHNPVKARNTVGPALLTRVIKAALFIQLLLLLLCLLLCLIPVCEDDNSCMHANNLQNSVMPMLQYTDGAPPI